MRMRQAAALLALCAILIVTTVSLMPAHGHECDPLRPCDICHSSHLPCLQPAAEVTLYVQMPVVWQHAPEDRKVSSDAAYVIRSPRAPPFESASL